MSRNRGLCTLGVGTMQFNFYWFWVHHNVGASHPKFNAFISMDHID